MGAVIMDELLFDVGESLSPQLQWLERHKIAIEFVLKENCWKARKQDKPDIVAEYRNHDDCLYELALMHGLKTWDEEHHA